MVSGFFEKMPPATMKSSLPSFCASFWQYSSKRSQGPAFMSWYCGRMFTVRKVASLSAADLVRSSERTRCPRS
jgi:hypothetical protein